MSLVGSGEVVAVARIAVAELAPEELVAFDRIAAEWSRRGVARHRARAAVGFGVDAALMTEIVLMIVSATLQELASGRPLRWWQRWRRRRRPATHRRRPLHRRARRARDASPPRADADRLRAIVDRYVADVFPETDPARRAVVRDAIVGAYLLPPTER